MVRFTVGSLSVTLNPYQWGYEDGRVYVERSFGTTPVGTFFKQRVGDSARTLVVTFANSDATISALRELSIHAMRKARRVQFFPDTTDLGTFRWIDWPTDFAMRHVTENYLRLELPLLEQV